MKKLILSVNEEEALKELLDEEIDALKNVETGENESYFDNLKFIRQKLNDDEISEDVTFGIEIGKLINSYEFKEVYKFLKDKKTASFFYADVLFDLYDKFGYERVNTILLKYGKEKFEVKKDE